MSMFPTHDPDTGLRVLIKQPDEVRTYRMNFSDLMHYGALVAVPYLVSARQGKIPGSSELTLGTATIVGPRVEFSIAGGTHEENYKVTARVEDADGNLIEGEGMLYVRDL